MKNIQLSSVVSSYKKEGGYYIYSVGNFADVATNENGYPHFKNITKKQNEKMKLLAMLVSRIEIDGEKAIQDAVVVLTAETAHIVITFTNFSISIKSDDIIENEIISILYPQLYQLIENKKIETSFSQNKVESKLISFEFPCVEFQRKWDTRDIELESTTNTNSGYKEIEDMLNVHFLAK